MGRPPGWTFIGDSRLPLARWSRADPEQRFETDLLEHPAVLGRDLQGLAIEGTAVPEHFGEDLSPAHLGFPHGRIEARQIEPLLVARQTVALADIEIELRHSLTNAPYGTGVPL